MVNFNRYILVLVKIIHIFTYITLNNSNFVIYFLQTYDLHIFKINMITWGF
jgi:hypothetical protein